jgi:hypothetical protein
LISYEFSPHELFPLHEQEEAKMTESKYPFSEMEINDSVLVPKEAYKNARANTDYQWRQHGKQFSWQKTHHGNYLCMRVERIRRTLAPSLFSDRFKALKVGDHFVVSAKDYAKAQPLGAYYSKQLGITLSWRRWPDGRHACTRLK